MAVESAASLITALLNRTLTGAIDHVVQLNDTAPSAALEVAGIISTTSATAFYNSSAQINGTVGEENIPQIPAYIRNVSMVFCIVIMCLGVIGNIMVSG